MTSARSGQSASQLGQKGRGGQDRSLADGASVWQRTKGRHEGAEAICGQDDSHLRG